MIEEGIRGGICHVIYQYVKVNKKYRKNCDKKESLYLKQAMKSYFMHYSFVVFILFNTGLCKSAFSTNSSRKLVFYRSALFVFSACCVSNLM